VFPLRYVAQQRQALQELGNGLIVVSTGVSGQVACQVLGRDYQVEARFHE